MLSIVFPNHDDLIGQLAAVVKQVVLIIKLS